MNAIQKIIKSRGLAYKMILYIFTSIAIIFFLIFLYNYHISRKIVSKNLITNAENLTSVTVERVEKVLNAVAKVTHNFSRIIESGNYSDEEMEKLLFQMVNNNSEIYGTALAYEPYYHDPAKKYYSPYYFREGNKISFKFLGDEQYDYFSMDWYQIPRELNRPIWSEPYYDQGAGDIIMSTYSVPIYKNQNGQKIFIGILTADISLDWLQEFMNSIKIYKTGYGFMISSNGTIVTHPDKRLIMNESIFSIADSQKSPMLRKIGKNMIHGEVSFAEFEYRNVHTGEFSWLSYAPVKLNNWSVGIVFPVKEFMADVNNLVKRLMIFCLIGLLILLTVIILISNSITRPLRALTNATGKFAHGDFNIQLPEIKSRDEIRNLNDSFIYMQNELARTINDLKDASAKLKLSNEKLEEYSRTLEQKVEERTSELNDKNKKLDVAFSNLKAAQAQLVQSEKMASLGQLTAGIAHEIKNPLNFINNFSELTAELATELKEEFDKLSDKIIPEDREYLQGITDDISSNAQKISEHGKRADRIIKGMLLHSRGRAGDKQPSDINAMLAEAFNLGYHSMRAQDNNFNIKVEADYDQSMEMINVVPQDISRVFLNIINNACYSTHEKKKKLKDLFNPVLKIKTVNSEKDVMIYIRDNGLGIPRDVLDKIFNPFFTTKPAGQGTGLGLSLSFDIVVHEHQGELKVETEENEYAEFIIKLPKSSA
jgi:signal transduction histidine kinase